MRFLIVDHYYPAAVDWIYGRGNDLASEPYNSQLDRVHDALFGETAFEVVALRDLGHEASDWLLNVRPLVSAWSRETGQEGRLPRLGTAGKCGWSPWRRRHQASWMTEGLLAQVRSLQPDVVHVQCVSLVSNDVVLALRRSAPLVIGQIAADIPTKIDLHAYSLMVSSVPALVRRFRDEGIDAEWLPLAFEASLPERIGRMQRDFVASFVGSISASHPTRLEVLSEVARVVPLDVWTADIGSIPTGSPVRARLHGQAFGRDMYRVLARTQIALNNHARVAAGEANNLRLFEATGMGALLLTEEAPNLRSMFDTDSEVITYRGPSEAAAAARYYADRPEEAAVIAAAGQRRTLRDHNWCERMARLVGFASERL